ncbi:ribonuclease III [Pseudoroseomonas cervicalis]|uniref:ribonuclease III n=1 Tax=Teichococcus cervicalis TaxID=204525 RepID=UPI0022F14A55|nr:ribonuclease III [Pseudoroseomonas cervicalis]WBV41873.1 ribonuclease III [Pseudoroseomonas cervicalis]
MSKPGPAAPAGAGFLSRLGHEFRDKGLLEQALTHRSAANPRRDMLDSNERLEFLGDRVLALVMAEWLSERFPAEREGALGKRLSVLVAADTLAKVGEAIGLPAMLRVPPAEGRTGLRGRATVIADATEALIGALYLDAGLEVPRRFIRREWAEFVAADPTPPMSAKSRLQEHTLGRAEGLPEYRQVSVTGPSHQPVFVVAVRAGGREAEGQGDSKRAAEQAAAEAWLAGLGDTK